MELSQADLHASLSATSLRETPNHPAPKTMLASLTRRCVRLLLLASVLIASAPAKAQTVSLDFDTIGQHERGIETDSELSDQRQVR